MVDGSEMPKECVLSNDGTLCMDRRCNFHEYVLDAACFVYTCR